jgi:hypothetical protein
VEAIDMKRSLLIAFSLALFATTAFSQAGSIMLFSDPGATNCDVYDIPGLVVVYVVHMYTSGATGAQFRVDHMSWGAGTLMWIADAVTPPYVPVGNSQTGIQIGYGLCMISPNLILQIQYLAQGLSPPCSYIQVVSHPTATPPGILVADCAIPPILWPATGGDVVVNPDPTCMCDIPVQETTWGQIKALYQ